jgi:hypothetical membrane protein
MTHDFLTDLGVMRIEQSSITLFCDNSGLIVSLTMNDCILLSNIFVIIFSFLFIIFSILLKEKKNR